MPVPRMTIRRRKRKRAVLPPAPVGYTGGLRNKFPLADCDFFRATLRPLLHGKTVILSMDDGRPVHAKAVNPERKKRIVVLVKPSHPQVPKDAVLVSILGKGSCLIRPRTPQQSANLVLAGMPAKLANALLGTLRDLED